MLPYIGRASSETRNSAVEAISSGFEKVWLLGVMAFIAASTADCAGSLRIASFIGVSVLPGAMALTLMLKGASSAPRTLVSIAVAALLAQ